MATKKTPGAQPKDRHKGTIVRLPADLVDQLKALAAKNYRPMSMELRLAVENHLERNANEKGR